MPNSHVGKRGRLQVATERFGEIQVDEDSIIHVEQGILGFPEKSKYVLLPHAEDSPFQWLQSIDDPKLAFVATNPLAFFPDYTPEINDADVADINLENPEDAALLVLVTIPEEIRDITINLVGPIVINRKNFKAKQVIALNEEYTTKHRILAEEQGSRK